MSQTTLEKVKEAIAPMTAPVIAMNMDTVGGFESMQRAAKLFASSTIVPKEYQNNLSNCFIAVDMAMRMQANPLMVMQNLYIVHGNPAWSAQFLIATFNKCGRFSALRYEFQGEPGRDDWGCRAIAKELATGEILTGPLITISMAKKSGWYSKLDKNGKESSRWQSMPEQMLRYRAASWFVRVYAPEIAMGLRTVEEERDAVIDLESGDDGIFSMTMEDLERQTEKPEKPEEPVKESATPEAVPASKKKLSRTVTTPGDIVCPHENSDGTPRLVEAEDCEKCKDRSGCPAHE